MEQKATYYPSTHPGVMVFSFLLISGLLGYLFHTHMDGTIEPWQVILVCALFWAGAVFYGLKWMHQAWFTPDGVVLCRLGKEYRRIQWNDVVQVGLAKEYKASKLTLVITPANCPKYENSNSTTTSYVEHYRSKLILLDGTKENVAAVRSLYGELSYNAKNPHSKP